MTSSARGDGLKGAFSGRGGGFTWDDFSHVTDFDDIFGNIFGDFFRVPGVREEAGVHHQPAKVRTSE